jgi:hypothetical protein
MSIDDPTVVDFIALERDGSILVLVVSDHRDWQEPLEHIWALQEKLNSYAAFIESGDVWAAASKRGGRQLDPGSIPIQIRIFLGHEPPPVLREFVVRANEAFRPLGATITQEVRA